MTTSTSTLTTSHRTIIIILILLLITIGQGSIDIYLPSMPAIALYFQVPENIVKQTITVFLFGYAVSQLLYGPLSDRFGRRPILILGITLYLISTIACILAPNISTLLIARTFQGFGAGAPNALSRAIMRDAFNGKQLAKVSSYLTMLWALIPIVAPVSGGYLQTYFGWQMNFVVLAVLGVLALLVTAFLIPETRATHLRSPLRLHTVIKNYLFLLTNRIFLGNMAGVTLLLSIFFTLSVVGPFLFQVTLGFSPVIYGWITLSISAGYFLGSLGNSRLVEVISISAIYKIGFLISLVSAFFFILFALLGWVNLYAIIIPLFVILFGIGLIYANCIAACLMPFHHIAGSASAMYGFLALGGSSIVSGLASHLSIKTQLPFAMTVFVLLFSSLIVLLVLTPRPISEES